MIGPNLITESASVGPPVGALDCRTLQEPSEDNIIMSGTDLLCLNRIIKPQIPLEGLLQFTADLGIKYVEVRNDFADKGILDGLSDDALQKLFKETGIQVLTINAL